MNLNFTVPVEPARFEVTAPQETSRITRSERIHAIDWLRVLAFAILMIYHTAEVFTTWNWWIKNDETSALLSYVMKFFHEWRMFLLFVISGAATHLALGKRSAAKFLNDRILRILIPLFAGMLLVIPPQVYFIRLNQGQDMSYTAFYADLLQSGWFPQGNLHWLHLWYMAFLFAFVVLMIPVIAAIKTERGKRITGQLARFLSNRVFLLSAAVLLEAPFYLAKFLDLHENVRTAFLYFPYYAFGALFLVDMNIRNSLISNRRTGLLLAACTTTAFYLFFWIRDSSGSALISLPLTEGATETARILLKSFNRWFWVLTIAGYGLHYLTRGNRFLNYANQAVAPFYILHQTVIILVAYYTVDLSLDIPVKFYMILSLTFLSIFLLYHFVLQRLRITQILFGIKRAPKARPAKARPFLYSRNYEPDQTEAI
ncbi:MAG TPA: acyltransferase [Sphingobacteriaceae bacterium]